MQLLRSFGKPKKPSLLLRRVEGDSMSPSLRHGQLILASSWPWHPKPGDIIVARHNQLEKIKRIQQVDPRRGVFVLGDNPLQSTDSRHFGWLLPDEIVARVIWPRNRLLS